MESGPSYVKYIIGYEDDEDWYAEAKPIQVYEDDEPQPTGILDANGNELFRVRERQPIGFKTCA